MDPSGDQKNKKSAIRSFFDELREGDLLKTIRTDLDEITRFYLDREKQAQLESMNPFKRWAKKWFWILKSLIAKLSSIRRILLILSLIFIFGNSSFTETYTHIEIDFRILGYMILMLILMLELKDKLLAKDELNAGRAVQFALMPNTNPELSGWSIWCYTRPANEVGGDLVDYLKTEESFHLFLGDVAGKGLGAALLMSKLQATLRALVPHFPSMAKLGREMNRIFCRDGLPSRFISLVCLSLAPDSPEVRILNAGHLPPIWTHKRKAKEMDMGGPALGLVSNAVYQEQRIRLRPGDFIVVYSDGITEARNESDQFFGDQNLLSLLESIETKKSDEIGNRILASLQTHVGNARQSDDLSLIILRYGHTTRLGA